MICTCKYCDSVIEYDESDYQLAYGYEFTDEVEFELSNGAEIMVPVRFRDIDEIYIICPVCGKSITVGTIDII